MEKSHCELEQYHYKALQDPRYVAEGLADCYREELSMSMPYPNYDIKEPPLMRTYLARRDRKEVDELKVEVLHYRKEIAELQSKVDKLEGKLSKNPQHTDYDVDDIVTSVTNQAQT